MLSINSPSEVQQLLAKQAQEKRKWMGYSRAEAAKLAGIPAPTLRRFEDTGELSLRQFLMLMHVYGDLSVFDHVFAQPIAKTMHELIALNAKGMKS